MSEKEANLNYPRIVIILTGAIERMTARHCPPFEAIRAVQKTLDNVIDSMKEPSHD